MATEIDLGKVTGDKGEQGDPGSQWYYGTAITGTESPGTVFHGSGIENATVNDKYLNTGTGSDSGNVYTCVLAGDADTAQWSYAGSIRGAQGPQGPQGTTGAVDENTPIEFTEATTLTNLSSGESISVLFGKVAKAVSGLLSGAASTLLSALTANRALISDNNGKVAPSSVTKKELEYLSGAESNIQDQLDELTQNMTRTSNAVTSGYPVTNYDTYKENGIQHIKAVISATVSPSAAEDGYFTIGFAPEVPLQTEMFSGIYLYNSHIYPVILRVTANKNIGIYISDEITSLGNSSGNMFIETSYSI